MKLFGKGLRAAGLAAGLLLAAFPCLAFGEVQEEPGMVNGQAISSEGNSRGVIRRDSSWTESEEKEKQEQETEKSSEENAVQTLPGVSVDNLQGLSYDIRRIQAAQSEDVEQFIVISGHDGTYARVTMYQKNRNSQDPSQYQWTVLVDTEGRMGRNGMGKEIEGDEKTPVGLYQAGMVFGNKENPGTQLPYTHVTETQYWVGDSNSPYYNQFADTQVIGNVFDKSASEHLSAYGAVYNYCIDMGYNPQGTPHKGSALFLHCTNGYGTAGCVGIPEEDMKAIVCYLKPGAWFLLDEEDKLAGY